jgi:nucleoside-diphosphate-sugar epimerase
MIDLVHIEDVTMAYVTAAERLVAASSTEFHECFAVSSGRPIRIRDLAAEIESAAQRPLRVTYGARPYREREVMLPWTRGEVLPGWIPRIPLRAGLSGVIAAQMQPKNEETKKIM